MRMSHDQRLPVTLNQYFALRPNGKRDMFTIAPPVSGPFPLALKASQMILHFVHTQPECPHSLECTDLSPACHICDDLPYQEGMSNFDAPACQTMSRLLFFTNIVKYVRFHKG